MSTTAGDEVPTIIVATDGSEHAERAIRLAIGIVRDDAKVVVASAIGVPDLVDLQGTGFAGPVVTPEEVAEMREAATELADREIAQASGLFGDHPVEERIIDGDPGPALASLAEEIDAELIVVGSHGKGLVGRFLEGSTSRYLLDHAPCPVLVVPPEDR